MPPRFRIPKVPDEFMYSGATVESCSDIIDELLRKRVDQERLDELYDKYVEVYCGEMKSFFREIQRTPKSKKALRHAPKSYWDEQMSILWYLYHTTEKAFVAATKDDPNYQSLFNEFKERHRVFDRRLRKEKGAFQR